MTKFFFSLSLTFDPGTRGGSKSTRSSSSGSSFVGRGRGRRERRLEGSKISVPLGGGTFVSGITKADLGEEGGGETSI